MTSKTASFTLRTLACLSETSIFILIFIYLLFNVVGQPTLASALTYIIYVLALYLLNPFIVYQSVYLTYFYGGSIGKLLTGLRVVNENGNKLSGKRVIFRQTAGYTFSGLVFGLGFWSILKDPEKQGWHDKAVGSRVIVKQTIWPLALTVCIISLTCSVNLAGRSWQIYNGSPLKEEIGQLIQQIEAANKKPEFINYTNPNFHYKILYPSDWQLDANNPYEVKIENKLLQTWGTIYSFSTGIRQSNFDTIYQAPSGSYISLPGKRSNAVKISNMQIDGIDAVKYYTTGEKDNKVYYEVNYGMIQRNASYYLMQYTVTFGSTSEEAREKNMPVFDKIVNSFKFIQTSKNPVLEPAIKPTAAPQSPPVSRDQIRAADLRAISRYLSEYDTTHKIYPANLDELSQGQQKPIPVDPLTSKSYEYYPIQNRSNFNLCARFETITLHCIYPGSQGDFNGF